MPEQLVLLTGVGGTGKTKVVEKLIERYTNSGRYIKNVTKDGIADEKTTDRGVGYKAKHRDSVYRKLFYLTAQTLRGTNGTVVVDASFSDHLKSPDWENPYRSLALAENREFRAVRLVLPVDILRKRIEERKSPYDRHKLESPEAWERWLKEEPIYGDERDVPGAEKIYIPEGTLILDNTGGLDSTVERLIGWLSSPISATSEDI